VAFKNQALTDRPPPLATGGFIAAISGADNPGAMLGVIWSTIWPCFEGLEHRWVNYRRNTGKAGADVWIVREKYLSLSIITNLRMREKPAEALQKGRDQLL
jgi:hypothetical protein